jgi:hypothetical protein
LLVHTSDKYIQSLQWGGLFDDSSSQWFPIISG